jgi:hypothetical protein
MIIFAFIKFIMIQILISKIYKEKLMFEALHGFKLFLFLSNATMKTVAIGLKWLQ